MIRCVILTLFVFAATNAFSQDKPRVLAEYRHVQRLGNLLTRWYYDLRGTSLVWKKTLTLYSDSTYNYTYRGGECGTFDENRKGLWSVNKDTLNLSTDNDMFVWRYIMANGKLYAIETDVRQHPDRWEMK